MAKKNNAQVYENNGHTLGPIKYKLATFRTNQRLSIA